MRILSLEIDGLTRFKDFRLTFAPNRTALFGVNGVGKTTILNLLSECVQCWDHVSGRPESRDIKFGGAYQTLYPTITTSSEGVIAEFGLYELAIRQGADEPGPVRGVAIKPYPPVQPPIERRVANVRFATLVDIRQARLETERMIYFSARRRFTEKPATEVRKTLDDANLLISYPDGKAGNNPNPIHQYLLYLFHLDAEETANKGRVVRTRMDSVKAVINQLFHDKKFDRIENMEILFKDDAGREFSLYDLSHGEKEFLTFAMEFHRYGWHDSVIMIDEPEQGLHPDWQRRLIPTLEKLGRNNQFIVATHSPEIVYHFEQDEVRYLKG